MKSRDQQPGEEKINALTHAIGIVFCVIATPVLLLRMDMGSTPTLFYASLTFMIGMLLVYTSSTLYHLASDPQKKVFLKKIDHICIYILIAGSYTPFITEYTSSQTAFWFLSLMWLIVLLGAFFKLFFIDRLKRLSVVLYLVMGWMIIFVAKPIYEQMPLDVFYWVLAGGLSYTIGVYFYATSHKLYHHAIWHVFVLGGSISHYMAVSVLVH